MAELDGRSHLAALDQVGVRLENGVDLLIIGDLLDVQPAAACLIDKRLAYPAKVLNLLAQLFDGHGSKQVPAGHVAGRFQRRSRAPYDLFGNADERAVCSKLLLVALPRRHGWISYMRRRAERMRSRKPLIRRSFSALARRVTKRVTTRTTSHNNVLSVG